jgi:hypothetical protein
MSDIRLRKISIENGPLIIQNNYVSITNTNISTNKITGALVSDGGVAINCTHDSVSSTSGGALTIGGGISVKNQTFLGNNLILDNTSSEFLIKGVTTNRLLVDTSQFYISPDGVNTRLIINNTSGLLNIATSSTNSSTGAFIINGGLSINTTADVINASSGGAVTIAGGVGIGGNTNMAKTLTVGDQVTIRYNGLALQNSVGNSNATLNMSGNNLFLNNSVGNIHISSDNISLKSTTITFDTTSTFNKSVSIIDTIESLCSTIGSLIVSGGVSVKCTTDATSSSSGGGITIAGGVAISKKTFIEDSLGLQVLTNSKPNKLVLYQSSQNLSESVNFTGLGTTLGSLLYQIGSTSGCHTFYAGDSEIFRIKGTNEVQFIGDIQRYSIMGNSNSLALQGQSSSTGSSLDLFTMDGTGNDNSIKIFGYGNPNLTSNSESMTVGWDSTTQNYSVTTNNSGTGATRNLVLQSGNNIDQLMLSNTGTITLKSTTSSVNSSTGGVYLTGGLSINCTTDAISTSSGGALTVAGGASFGKSVYVSNQLILNVSNTIGNINMSSTSIGTLLIGSPNNETTYACNNTVANTYSSISMYSLNNQELGDYSLIKLNTTQDNYTLTTLNGGSGIKKSILFNSVGDESPQIYIATSGNIGIMTTNPSYSLDINGDFNVTSFSYINGLNIYNTDNSTNLSSASLTVSGGVSIKKDLLTDGLVHFLDVTSCSNSSTASVVLDGGLSINCFTNATTVSNGGALTVAGGVAIAGDLIIGGSITYADAAQASNTYAYLTLTASDPSDNLANGALVTFGGVSIQSTFNATSVTSGGGLTVAGGTAIGSDLYIGNNIYSDGTITFYANTASNLINFYDQSNIERFSMDLNLSNNAYEISRYNPLGFVETAVNISNVSGMTTFNNTSPSTNSGNGTLSVAGGIGIQSTKDAIQLGNGGGLTVSGGASIYKKVFIGGDTVFSSTTVSNGYTSGSIIVAGGVGVTGNLNIGGSTIISGDLTVIGTTTTLESQNTILSDNILLLNAGPAGSADAGFLIQRYQQVNDNSTGDVVSDVAFFNDTIPNQSGMSSSQIKLSTNASVVDNYYTGWWLKVTSGLSAGQVRQITSYIGLTRIATLGTTFTIQNPSIADTVSLYNKPYVGVVFSQSNNRFEFGSSATDSSTTVSLTDTLPIYFSSATSTSTQPSTSASIGGLVLSGGLSSTCITGATSITSGGSLTIAGGASIAKNLYIGTELTVNGVNMTPNKADIPSSTSFINLLNDNTADITGLVFPNYVFSFDIYISVQLIASTNLYSNYQIRGCNMGTNWQIVQSYVGDSIIDFSITSSGQIQYISQIYPGFVSLNFRFKCITN